MLLRLVLGTANKSLCQEEVAKLINKQDTKGRTALMFAVASMEDDCVCKLLSHDADANVGMISFMLRSSSY
jgi:ankyrin repeat protein